MSLPMIGLEKAAAETKNNESWGHTQISYDIKTGEVLTDWHHDDNNWTQYRDKSIIIICATSDAMTEEDIAERITERMAERAAEMRETPQQRYAKRSIVPLQLRLNRNTDADILAKLDAVGNKQGYIKGLIRKDIKKTERA